MKKGWTTIKLITTGSLAVLFLIISLLGGVINATTGIPIMGGAINSFVTPAMTVLCLLIINKFGSATLMLAIVGILELPFPLTGTPGFLPKILILIIAGLFADSVFSLDKNKKLACISIGGPMMVYLGWSIVLLGRLFNMPGVDRAAQLASSPPIIVLGLIMGSVGSYLGYLVYQKVKETSIVKRIQN